MRFLFILVAALAGCAEKAVELRLDTSGLDNLDVSCVDTIDVVVDTAESFTEDCVTVTGAATGVMTVADIQQQIRDKYTHAMPAQVQAIEIAAMTGSTPGLCGTGAVVFYGAEEFAGQEAITVHMEGTLSCRAMKTSSNFAVRPIDFMAFVDTPAIATAPVCRTPTGIVDLSIGTIRPTNLDLPNYWSSRMNWGAYADVDTTTGIATLPAWGESEQTSCLATASDALWAASCIYPSNASPCGTAGEVIVPIVRDTQAFESVDQALFTDFPVLVLGIVYDTTTKKPVAGATVAIDAELGHIVYADRGAGNRFDPKQVAATTASGLFVAYMREPSMITVTQGTSKKAMRVGGQTDLGAAVIVPLR